MQGGVFGVVGLGAGIVGTCVSNGLIAVRKALDPAFEPQNSLPNVPLNAACKSCTSRAYCYRTLLFVKKTKEL